VYAVDLDDHYEAFLEGRAGYPEELEGYVAWLDYIRELTASGKRMERVRVQDEPLSDYHRYARWVGRWNVEAGEIIHYITHQQAEASGLLPAAGPDDWWFLDDSRLVVMEFDDEGNMVTRRLVTDDAALARARTLWERALAAVPS
jgi:hypothetical protein